jgi:hypothetical protein
MATDIRRYKYQTDNYDNNGQPDPEADAYFTFYVEMDSSNVAADKAGTEPNNAVDIDLTLNSFENKGKYGLHPRYVELARVIEGDGVACLIQKGEIPRKLVILTPTRFNAIVPRNKPGGGTATTMTLDSATWVVVRKVPERRNKNHNAAIQGRYKA